MPKVLSWLHLSDIHFGANDLYTRELALGSLLRTVKQEKRAVDLLFATGDIAFSGKTQEYELAGRFFDQLLEAANLKKKGLFVIPGNHDIDRELATDTPRTLQTGDDADAFFNPDAAQPHYRRQQAFREWYGAYFRGVHPPLPTNNTCQVHSVQVKEVSIRILAINSALFCCDSQDLGKLWIGARCLERVMPQVTAGDPYLRVALIHHPISWLADQELAAVQGLMEGSVDVVLRGHLHVPEAEMAVTRGRTVLRLAAGACYEREGHHNNVIFTHVDLEDGAVLVRPMSYGSDGRGAPWLSDRTVFPYNPRHVGEFFTPWRGSKRTEELYQIPFTAPVPRQPLTGRTRILDNFLVPAVREGRSIALVGESGRGKTALATELVSDVDVRSRFPGGVLWAGLGDRPDPLAALGAWAGALGLPLDEVGALCTPETRAAAVGNVIQDRAVLIVLDDVRDAAAAGPLRLPLKQATFVITTIDEEVAKRFFGTTPFDMQEVELLRDDDTVTLLGRAVGLPERGTDTLVDGLARDVGGLPLAVNLMASYLKALAGEPADRFREARARLSDAKSDRRNGAGGLPPDLREVLDVCVLALDSGDRDTLLAMAVFPAKPSSFSRAAATVVAQATDAGVAHLLKRGLIEAVAGDRLSLHQLITAYAAERLAANPTQHDRASRRLAEYYAGRTQVQSHVGEVQFYLEKENFMQALRVARTLGGLDRELVGMLNGVYPWVEARGLYADPAVQDHMLEAPEAARRLRDAPARARALLNLGRAFEKLGQYGEADGHLRGGIRALGGRGETRTARELRHRLGVVRFNRSDYAGAEKVLREGLESAVLAADSTIECHILQRLGLLALYQGDVLSALRLTERAAAIAEALRDDRSLMPILLTDLGRIALRRELYRQAEELANRGLRMASEAGILESIAALKQVLSRVEVERGDFVRAMRLLDQARDIAGDIRHRWYESFLLNEKGRLLLRQRRWDDAAREFDAALTIANAIECRDLAAMATFGHAQAHAGQGNERASLDCAKKAMRSLEAVGHYRAAVVREWIAMRLIEWGEQYLTRGAAETAESLFRVALDTGRSVELRATAVFRWAQAAEQLHLISPDEREIVAEAAAGAGHHGVRPAANVPPTLARAHCATTIS